ncbi:MAG: polyprenyl synthetase family protein [Sulfurospirillum sp.]|nr:polyprenyl synthetase family protein [Sulfurospirillum sp.]
MKSHIEAIGDSHVLGLYEKVPKGKRLRAKLILKIASQNQQAIELAAVVELIHAASLLHDDVIDDALTRRGEDSINALFGNKTSIMLGDILYAKGFFELSKLPSQVAQIISNAVVQLSTGELLDVELAHEFNTNAELYFDMIYKKTASLIEASATAAAYLAHKDVHKYAIYGKNLGLAFQIIDDILDITQNAQTLGKPALNDFKEGKTTLPYLYMYEKLTQIEQEKLLALFAKTLSEDEASWIQAKMQDTQAITQAIQHAKKLGEEALQMIADEGSTDLENIMKAMIEREF